jgi:hypothetical protein
MENAVIIAQVAAPMYLTIGLSVLLYAKTWEKIMDKWKKDHLSLFPLMFMYPILGVIVIRMYNVWELNIWLIVTLIGWILLFKGVMYFLMPGALIKKIMDIKNKPAMIYPAALTSIAIGGVLGYYAYFA